MLPSENRMVAKSAFAATMRRGRRRSGSLVVVYLKQFCPPDALFAPVSVSAPEPLPAPAPTVGLVVGRRVGSAVVRNQVKRRLRAIMANVIGRLNRGAGVVIRALPGAGTASFAALRTDVEGALGALGGYGR